MSIIESINPASEDVIGSFQCTNFNDIDSFLEQSSSKLSSWKYLDTDARITVLKIFSTCLEAKKTDFINLICQENGKSLNESQLEVTASISKIQLSLHAFENRLSATHLETETFKFSTTYKPIGNLVVLGPFNFPLLLPLGHIIPALLVGNSVLFKPSELTSLVAQLCVDCLYEAGVPKTALQLVLGGVDHGKYCVSHSKVDGVLFTGGYQAAQSIANSLSSSPEKMLALECGGNNPLIVSSFKNKESVADCLIQSAFLTSGQRCTSMRRLILIRSSQTDHLLNTFLDRVRLLTIGSYQDKQKPFMGPLISEIARKKFFQYVTLIQKRGGKTLYESQQLFAKGYFVSPYVFDISSCYEKIPDDECFGPLLQVIYVDSLKEAVQVANRTSYGLSASLISTSSEEFDYVYNHVQAGIINWNKPTNGSSSQLPFGGIGKSGNFRPAGYFAIDSCVYPVASVQNKQLL